MKLAKCGAVSLALATTVCAVEGETLLAPEAALPVRAKIVAPQIVASRNQIFWLNQSDGTVQRASLVTRQIEVSSPEIPGAIDFCFGPDKTLIYVAAAPQGHNRYRKDEDQRGRISVLDAETLTQVREFAVPVDPSGIVSGADNKLYVVPGSGQWVKIFQIDPTRDAVNFSFGTIYSQCSLRILPNGRKLYLATNGLSPGDVSASSLPASSKSQVDLYDSPYHGEHALGGDFDLSPDGKYLINRHGVVLRLGSGKAADMRHVQTLAQNRAVAFDVEKGRMWLLTSEGKLMTYKYPAFELEVAETLLSSGSSLVYDPARSALWVAWDSETAGVSSWDIYNLAAPAPFPNEITRARHSAMAKPAAATTRPENAFSTATRRIVAAQAQTAPEGASAAPAAKRTGKTDSRKQAETTPAPEPSRSAAELRAAAVALIRRDRFTIGGVVVCGLLLPIAFLLRRRAKETDSFRGNNDEDYDDPSTWPLPTSIQFFGWFGFLQVAAFCYLAVFLPAAIEDIAEILSTARTLVVFAVILACVCVGVLRGKKFFYAAYVLFLVVSVIGSLSMGSGPGFGTIVFLIAALYFGKQNWEQLT